MDGIKVHRVGSRMTFGLLAPLYLKRKLNPDDFDVVVEDLNKVPVFMPFWTKTPVVLLVHHLFGTTAFLEASLPVAAGTWLLERPLPRVFGGIPTVAVSESTVTDLRDRGMSQREIAVVPNGVDLERLTSGKESDRFSEPTILYLGRLKRYKGIDLVLRAVAETKKFVPHLRLLIAGKGDYLEKLRSLAGDLQIRDSVEFLGYVPEEEKIRLLQRSWIHVLTSPKEGWGISILEAAACGTPTVASNSPGLRDAVIHEQTGLLVPHGDVGALSGSLRRLLENEEVRREMSTAAREFSEGFTWDSSAKRMEAFLLGRVAGVHQPS